MKNCKYIIDKLSYTYLQLLDMLLENPNILTVSDIVYSKASKLEKIYLSLNEIKLEYFAKTNNSLVDGEPIITDDNTLSIQEFIDTPQFNINGHPLIMKINTDNYLKNKVELLVKNEKLDLEKALYLAQQELKNWETIGLDSLELHKIITDFDFRQSLYEFILKLKGTKFEGIAEDLYASLINTFKTLVYGKVKQVDSSKTIKNLGLKAYIDSLGLEIAGHIDYLIIDSTGDLHLYNFKTTTEDSDDWTGAKVEKYKYQLALLKQMLSNKGINVKNMSLNIIPIRLKYNEDFSKIESAIPEERKEYTVSDKSKYIFGKYDRVAKHFIKSKIALEDFSNKVIEKANIFLKALFPERAIKADGINQTAEEWININYRNRTGIIEVNLPDHAYDVIIPGLNKPIPIKSPVKPDKNLEMLNVVILYMELLDNGGSVVARRLAKDIINSYDAGFPNFTNGNGFSYSALYLNTTLRKYFNHKIINDKKNYEWEFIDDDILLSANILVFRNNKTGLLDVITLSSYDLSKLTNLSVGNSILGSYISDTKAIQLFGDKFISDFGNIEAVRTMTLLNEILPTIVGDFKLGLLKILTPIQQGKGRIFSIELLNSTYFSKIIKVINQNNKDLEYKNNFSDLDFIDPLELLLQEYKSLVDSNSFTDSEKLKFGDLGFSNLEEAGTKEAKIIALETVLHAILSKYKWLNTSSKNILKMMDDTNPLIKKVANLYYLVVNAYSKYSGLLIFNIAENNSLESYGFTANRNPNKNSRLISNLFIKTADKIAENTSKACAPVRKFILDFYEKAGYSVLLNSIIGNSNAQFKNLFQRDINNNLTLTFKNPYTDPSLEPHEKEFLKKTLFIFNKVRAEMHGKPFNFENENDPKIKEHIEENYTYLWVPLKKASESTRRQTGQVWKLIKDNIMNIFRNPSKIFEEYVNGTFTEEELRQRLEDVEHLSLSNRFIIGESVNSRNDYLNKHSINFFETNVENLLIDFIESHIANIELNKMLIKSKCILLQLELLGEESGEHLEKTIKEIDDILKLNVFNQSIMEPNTLNIIGRLTPLKRGVSKMLIAGNVIGAFRDTFEGLWQNIARTINHYQTDIDAKSLSRAYKEVVLECFHNVRNINIVNELCKIYRLSNLDISRISEGLKTTRGGIFNYDEWAYATLRRPDFLNRMVLFVARCVKDGCWDAFSIEEGKLSYNWRKDTRFKAYAENSSNTEEYNKARSLYFSAIRAYNEEHPDNVLNYTDDLPMPYTNNYVNSIKNVANSIYGAYDKSMKAKYENIALGWALGLFTTWMNGLINNYFAKPGLYEDGPQELLLAVDEFGNLLYFDKQGNITTEKTDNMVMEYVPVVVQGVYYTVKQVFKILGKNGINNFELNWDDLKFEIWLDPINRKNLNKLLSDLFIVALFLLFFNYVITPTYKEYKKEAHRNSILLNAMVEVLYKSTSRSYDGFMGPINVIEQFGENMNPPMYTHSLKVTTDMFNFLFGDKTLIELGTGAIAPLRSFQDTFNAYQKANK